MKRMMELSALVLNTWYTSEVQGTVGNVQYRYALPTPLDKRRSKSLAPSIDDVDGRARPQPETEQRPSTCRGVTP